MLDRGGARRGWGLLPILIFALFTAQPEAVSAQQTTGFGNLFTPGAPANGPSPQLFSSASNSLLFSPPPPLDVPPPPPPPTSTPSPARPPPATPPPPVPQPPPPPALTASPVLTPSPTLSPPSPTPPPPSPNPSPPSQTVRSSPPTPVSSSSAISTPGTSGGSPPSPTAIPSPSPPPNVQSPPPPSPPLQTQQSSPRSPPPSVEIVSPPPIQLSPPPPAPVLSPPPNPVFQPSPTALANSPPPPTPSPPSPVVSGSSNPNLSTPGTTQSNNQNSANASNSISPPPSPTRASSPNLGTPQAPAFQTPGISSSGNGSNLSTPGLSSPSVSPPPVPNTVTPPPPSISNEGSTTTSVPPTFNTSAVPPTATTQRNATGAISAPPPAISAPPPTISAPPPATVTPSVPPSPSPIRQSPPPPPVTSTSSGRPPVSSVTSSPPVSSVANPPASPPDLGIVSAFGTNDTEVATPPQISPPRASPPTVSTSQNTPGLTNISTPGLQSSRPPPAQAPAPATRASSPVTGNSARAPAPQTVANQTGANQIGNTTRAPSPAIPESSPGIIRPPTLAPGSSSLGSARAPSPTVSASSEPEDGQNLPVPVPSNAIPPGVRVPVPSPGTSSSTPPVSSFPPSLPQSPPGPAPILYSDPRIPPPGFAVSPPAISPRLQIMLPPPQFGGAPYAGVYPPAFPPVSPRLPPRIADSYPSTFSPPPAQTPAFFRPQENQASPIISPGNISPRPSSAQPPLQNLGGIPVPSVQTPIRSIDAPLPAAESPIPSAQAPVPNPESSPLHGGDPEFPSQAPAPSPGNQSLIGNESGISPAQAPVPSPDSSSLLGGENQTLSNFVPAPSPAEGPTPTIGVIPIEAQIPSPSNSPAIVEGPIEAPIPAPSQIDPQAPSPSPISPVPSPESDLLPGSEISPIPAPAPEISSPAPSPGDDVFATSSESPIFVPAPAPSPDTVFIPVPEIAPVPGPAEGVSVPAPSPSDSLLPVIGTIPILGPAPAPSSIPNLSPDVEAPSPQIAPADASVPAPELANAPAPQADAPSPNSALPVIPGLGPGPAPSFAPEPSTSLDSTSPVVSPASEFSPDQGVSPRSDLAPSPEFALSPGDFLTSVSPGQAPSPFSLSPGPASAPSQDPIAYSSVALSPSLEADRVLDAGPPLAPSPSYPSWLAGAQRIGTDLYHVDSGNNTGFYNVIQQPSGDTTETYAFSTVPQGTNLNTFQPNNVALGFEGYDIYPFNETYQAAVMNQLHVALDQAGVGHTMKYSGTTNNTGATGTTGRRLLQANNADNITSSVTNQNQTATLDVKTQNNITVSIVVSVAPGDQNNLTSIVNQAIDSGQVRRGLLQAGANVTNAQVTGVSAISAGSTSPSTPSNTASPTPQSSSGVSAGVIGGAVGGGCAAVALLALILYRVHARKMKKHMDLEASPAAKLSDSSSDEGYAYRPHNEKYRYSSNGTSESDERPRFIKTMKGGMQDVSLLSSGYTGSMDSPYAHSIQPKDLSDRTSPDSPGWEEYRQKILTGIEKAASKHSLSHKIDANLWQVQWSDIELREEIGGGSFGKVHIAKWRETTVAVKVLGSGVIPEDKDSPITSPIEHSTLLNLEKEASMMASMRHPNVVMYIGVCLEVPALVTEYCARGSLHDVLRKWKSRPEQVVTWSRRIGMVLDAAKGMNYLHSSEPPVIHRDLKSPNLLVDKHWNVKICDFNLSKAIEENVNVMSSLGTTNPRWLAPEILSGKDYTFSSDVYSFGLIMWEMLTWTVPWNEISHWQCVHMVTEQKARPEIPNEETLPGPPGKQTFSGFAEYVELMRQCWDHEASIRPKFPHIIEVLRRLMATEAGHRDGRSSSLGTDQQGSLGLMSTGLSINNGLSSGTTQSPNGVSLRSSDERPSQRSSLANSRISPTDTSSLPQNRT